MDDSDSNVKRFHVLVREGLDFEEIARMIEEEIVQVDCVDRFGNTALMLAVSGSGYCVPTTCCLLIELGAQINARNKFGASPLNHALSNRQIDTALLLLRRGANPNTRTNNGNTPLLFAIQSGLTSVCLELLRYGADLNIRLNDGANAAFLAAQNGNLDLLKFLAASGANLALLREDQTNALLISCQIGHTNIVRELLKWYKQQNIMSSKTNDKTEKSNIAASHAQIIRRCYKKASTKGFTNIVQLLIEHVDQMNIDRSEISLQTNDDNVIPI